MLAWVVYLLEVGGAEFASVVVHHPLFAVWDRGEGIEVVAVVLRRPAGGGELLDLGPANALDRAGLRGEATLTLLGEGAEHDAHHCLEIPAFAIDDIDGTGELAGLPGVQRIAEAGGGRIHADDVLQARGQQQEIGRAAGRARVWQYG